MMDARTHFETAQASNGRSLDRPHLRAAQRAQVELARRDQRGSRSSFEISPKNNLYLLAKFILMNFYYQIDKFIIGVAKEYDAPGKKLLDIGAGDCPYRKWFPKLDYFAQDIKQNNAGAINYVGDIESGLGSVADGSFDYILCTQVIEHLKEPQRAFKEFNRLLKTGGKLFLTTNFIYQIHLAPNDYFRFTKYGLEYLGKSAGFTVEHLKPQGGTFHTLSYILATLPVRVIFKKPNLFYYGHLVVFAIPIALINLTAYLLDHFDKDKELVINYEVIYRKT